MQSDELEELQFLVENRQLGLQESIELISSFAQEKVKLDLSIDAIANKLDEVKDSLNEYSLREQVESLVALEAQMVDIDAKIKVITNRC